MLKSSVIYPKGSQIIDEKFNFKLNKEINICNWANKNYSRPDKQVEGRLLLLNLVKECGLPYILEYGTLLGSVREGKIIDKDTDADINILGSFKNNLWKIADSKSSWENYSDFRKTICYRILQKAKILYPNLLIDVHVNAYKDGPFKNLASGYILGLHKDSLIDWANRKNYLCTLTLWEDKKRKTGKLNYPNVLDIGIVDKDQYIFMYGNLCNSYLYEKTYLSTQGAHKKCMSHYGASYLIPLDPKVNDKIPREYPGDERFPELRKRCNEEPYSENLDKLVRQKCHPSIN